jgi:hypothetical protein
MGIPNVILKGNMMASAIGKKIQGFAFGARIFIAPGIAIDDAPKAN